DEQRLPFSCTRATSHAGPTPVRTGRRRGTAPCPAAVRRAVALLFPRPGLLARSPAAAHGPGRRLCGAGPCAGPVGARPAGSRSARLPRGDRAGLPDRLGRVPLPLGLPLLRALHPPWAPVSAGRPGRAVPAVSPGPAVLLDPPARNQRRAQLLSPVLKFGGPDERATRQRL